MKLNKIILTVALSACVGIFFAVAGQADTKKEAEATTHHPADQSAAQEATVQVQEPVGNENADTAGMPDYDISLFSHEVHVSGMGFGCVDCHSGIFEQAAGTAKAVGDFNMASFAEGKYCGACHDGSTAFSVKEEASCKRCHGSDMKQPRTIVFEKPVKAVVFNHTMHTDTIGLACADCHDGLFKMKMGSSEEQPDFTMESIYKGKYCGGCHNGNMAFNAKTQCIKCHIGVLGYNRLTGDSKKTAGHEKGGH
ncbi:MAG: hypothetical protein D3924_10310 [Candidatus Electrothrix sp. AR4]|nr:hypothetical protein [Candidatus Electrothrix sp. AR4]